MNHSLVYFLGYAACFAALIVFTRDPTCINDRYITSLRLLFALVFSLIWPIMIPFLLVSLLFSILRF